MIKKFCALAVAGLVLTACSTGGQATQSASSKAEIRERKAENAAIWKTRQLVSYGGKTFEIAVADQKTFAFIAPANASFSYSPVELEAAARSATGCQAKYAAGVLAFVGGYSETADLRSIQSNAKNFKYWRTDLTC